MSSEALREKLKISFMKTALSMLHAMSCYVSHHKRHLCSLKPNFKNMNVFQIKVVWKEQTRSPHTMTISIQWKSFTMPHRTLAAASTSIHSNSIQARGSPVVSFFIQHPGNHPTMWRSRMLESASQLFLPFVSNVWFSEACKSHISYTPIMWVPLITAKLVLL